jgi:inner membrane transporter RhtA
MSVNPVFAALIGTVVLGQHLDPASWPAVAVIVTANAVAVGTAADRSRGTGTGRAKAAGGVVAASPGRPEKRCADDARTGTVGAHDAATPHTTAVHRG